MPENQTPKLTREEFKKLRETLPEDWKATLAARFKMSKGYIANILCGNAERADVVLAAIKMAKVEKEKRDAQILSAKEAIADL